MLFRSLLLLFGCRGKNVNVLHVAFLLLLRFLFLSELKFYQNKKSNYQYSLPSLYLSTSDQQREGSYLLWYSFVVLIIQIRWNMYNLSWQEQGKEKNSVHILVHSTVSIC